MEQYVSSGGGRGVGRTLFVALSVFALVIVVVGAFVMGNFVFKKGDRLLPEVSKPDVSVGDEFEKNKLVAGLESDVVVVNDYVIRGYFLAIEGGGIKLRMRGLEEVSIKLDSSTVYLCQGRFVESTKGTRLDSLAIFVDYSRAGAPDPERYPKSQVGGDGLENFKAKVKPGNPVLVQINKVDGGYLEAEAVTLITEEPCNL